MKPQWPGRTRLVYLPALLLLAGAALLSGCSDQKTTLSSDPLGPALAGRAGYEAAPIVQVNPSPPSPLQSVTVEGQSVSLWPYTGASFDPAIDGIDSKDPMNLIFVGDVDPVKIRGALMALSGDRTAFGIPNVPPFNERWADAHGSAQTAYAGPDGWTGSVIQLRLGEYGPLRVHVRLFRTGAPFGEGGGVTLGGAHFELLVPGTIQHYSISWNVARDIVAADLVRSGLLVAAPSAVGPIYATPSYREVPDFLYNPLPAELKAWMGTPLGPVSGPVPIPSDGMAAVFHLEGTPAPAPGTFSQSFTIPFAQVIPKPLCADGPYDYVYVEGPVDLTGTATVDEQGVYTLTTRYSGRLTITPFDPVQMVPAGAPFTALIGETQEGQTGGDLDRISSRSRMLGQEQGGAEILMTDLKVSSSGLQEYRKMTQCLQPEPQP